MAVRQYIGARYVLKIYENSLDPTSMAWEDVAFEPLTVVEYGNNTYISRDNVPIGAGNPSVATSHWALFGSSNGAILDLQNRVGTLEGEYTDLSGDVSGLDTKLETYYNYNIWHNKKIVVYGDSLSARSENYWNYMVAKDPTIDVTNRAVGGTRIQDGLTAITAATDLDEFDVIVLAYGTNSWANTGLREMTQAYKQTFEQIFTKNSLIRLVCIAPPFAYRGSYEKGMINDFGLSIYDYCNEITYTCNMYGGISFNLFDLCGVNIYNYTDLMELSGTDTYVHPNTALLQRIADVLLSAPPSQTMAQGVKYFQIGTSPNGIYVCKMGNFFFIYSRGAIAVTDLEALNLSHIAPGGVVGCNARGQHNGKMAAVALNGATGAFSVSFATGDEDTTITGINMFGIFSSHSQPDW